MSEPDAIDVEVEDEGWTRTLPDVEHRVHEMARAALAGGVSSPSLPACAVTILLTDDESVRDLNSRFRGKDAPTNVLSFPAPETARPHLGDLALAYGVCAAEASAQGKSLADHLGHLVVHGVLHLFGYDHLADADATVMEEMEREILRRAGIADPYAPRDADVEF